MAVITYSGTADKILTGTSGKDRYVIDLALLADHRTRLKDTGGGDTLRIIDTDGNWATRSFVNTGDKLLWKGGDGGRIVIPLLDGLPEIEFLEWSTGTGSAVPRLQLTTDLKPESGGNIAIIGSRGADQIIVPDAGGGALGRSEVHAGGGSDTVTASGTELTVVYGGGGGDLIITPGPAAGEFHGGRHDDVLWGCKGNDSLYGGPGKDDLFGAVGKDILKGGKGRDTLNGGDGRDTLTGGLGADTLSGGAGADIFAFKDTRDEGLDTVADFQDGVDILQIRGGSFAGLEISQSGADTRIILSGGTVIVLLAIDQSLIDGADFDFV